MSKDKSEMVYSAHCYQHPNCRVTFHGAHFQIERTDLVATDSQSQDEPLKSAPHLKEIINYTCEDSDIPTAAIRAMYHKIDDLFKKERSRLIDELEAKLPGKKPQGLNVPDTLHRNTGFNQAITEVKNILEEAKNG